MFNPGMFVEKNTPAHRLGRLKHEIYTKMKWRNRPTSEVKLAQSLMAGTLGDLLTTRAMQYQQDPNARRHGVWAAGRMEG